MKFDGSTLKKRRAELGRSLIDAGTACSVPAEFIRALEEGALDQLPPRIFSLGIMRSYCDFLDLPADGYIAQLEEDIRTIEFGERAANATEQQETSRFFPRILPAAIRSELKTWIAVSGLLLLGWFSYSTLLKTDTENAQGQAQAASVETPRDSDRHDSDSLQ